MGKTAATARSPLAHEEPIQVRLDTRKDCWLAVSYMPWFQYDASAGQGRGIATPSETPGRLRLKFSPSDLHIPSLSWRTTSVGIVPLPPGIAIHIHPQVLEGWMDEKTGEVQLQYDSRFSAAIPCYSPPSIHVACTLSTEGRIERGSREFKGLRLQHGHVVLVGKATIPATGHWLTDTLLQLPAQCCCVLSATLRFEEAGQHGQLQELLVPEGPE